MASNLSQERQSEGQVDIYTKDFSLDVCETFNADPIRATLQGKLLRKFFKYQGPIDDLLGTYDQMLEEIPPILRSKPLIAKSDLYREVEVVFLNAQYSKPNYTEGTKHYPLYPENVRRNHGTYYSMISATPYMFSTEPDGTKVLRGQGSPMDIMRLPVMVKSKLCNLHGITDPKVLLELGEDPDDQGGYFIINGNDRVVVNIEKLQISKIFVFPSDGENPYCRTIVPTPSGTKLMQVVFDQTDGAIHLQMSAFKKTDDGKKFNSINVIHIIDMIDSLYKTSADGKPKGIRTVSDNINNSKPEHLRETRNIPFFKYLLQLFVPPDTWSKVSAVFSVTEAEYSVINTQGAFEMLTIFLGIKTCEASEKVERIRDVFDNQFFPNVSKRDFLTKIYMLVIMCARLILHKIGHNTADNKDSWSNKKIEGPGKTIAIEFRGIIRNLMTTAQRDITNKNFTKLDQIIGIIRFDSAVDSLSSAFVKPGHGVKSTFARQNMTDSLEGDNVIEVLSHLTKIDVPIDRNVKSPETRGVQATQLGYICPATTPDGNACGIVKNKSITAAITLDTSEAPLLRLLQETGYIRSQKSEVAIHYVLINGLFRGWTNSKYLYSHMVKLRRQGIVDRRTSVVSHTKRNYIEINTNSGRLVRPLLVVGDNGNLEIHNSGVDIDAMTFDEMVRMGFIEFIASEEEEFLSVASTLTDLRNRTTTIQELAEEISSLKVSISTVEPGTKDYSELKAELAHVERKYNFELQPYHYAELHPLALVSISASMIPFMNFNQSCRVSYQTKMFKQAMSKKHTNPYRFDGSTRQMVAGTTPIVRTVIDDIMGAKTHPLGDNVTIAIIAYEGSNQEDAFIFNLSSIQRGLFHFYKTTTYDTRLTNTSEFTQELGKPKPRGGETAEQYKYINENGLPSIGAVLKEGDCIIGKIQHNTSGERAITNVSETVNVDDYGVVEDVRVISDNKGIYIEVKLRSTRIPALGDKFAPRYAQKGTIGLFLTEDMMPFDQYGNTPDIIINPHSIPSRMTMGYVRELVCGTAAGLEGKVYDASGFQGYDNNKFKRVLSDNGYDSLGKRRLTRGDTGEEMECDIFMGLGYFQQLKHLTNDKFQVRERGRRDGTTHQALRGKKNQGAIRFGEMESHAAMSHGAPYFIRERLCMASDAYTVAYCESCGVISNYSSCTRCFTCPLCGRSDTVGKATIPYVFKYLIQILGSVGMIIRSNLIKEDSEADIMQGVYETRKKIYINEVDNDMDENNSSDEDNTNANEPILDNDIEDTMSIFERGETFDLPIDDFDDF